MFVRGVYMRRLHEVFIAARTLLSSLEASAARICSRANLEHNHTDSR